MKICVLDQSEVGQLRHYGIFPDCRNHKHISPTAAKQGVDDCLLTHPDSRLLTAVTKASSADYQWRNRPSGHFLGPKVRQLVAV